MTQIKKVKTSEGVQFYPQTHTKAVIDDNGYSVESRMQAVQDVVNQAQMAIGAVPSDLTPTEGSTNWVTSGGLFNATTLGDNVEIDLTQYTTVPAFTNTSTWVVNYQNYAGKFIPITPLKKYRITASTNNTFYAFLKTNTYSSGASINYATGCERVKVNGGTDSIGEAPSDALYMYVPTYTTADVTPQKVEEYNKTRVVDSLKDAQENLEEINMYKDVIEEAIGKVSVVNTSSIATGYLLADGTMDERSDVNAEVGTFNGINSTKSYYASGRVQSKAQYVPVCYYDSNGDKIGIETSLVAQSSTYNFSKFKLNVPTGTSIIKVQGHAALQAPELYEGDGMIDTRTEKLERLLLANVQPFTIYENRALKTDNTLYVASNAAYVKAYKISDSTKQYFISGYVSLASSLVMCVFYDDNGVVKGTLHVGNGDSGIKAVDEPITIPSGTTRIRISGNRNYQEADLKIYVENPQFGNYWSGKKCVWNGDSISYGSGLDNNLAAYPYKVCESLGMSIVNYAIGGTIMAKGGTSYLEAQGGKNYDEVFMSIAEFESATKDTSKSYLVKDGNTGDIRPYGIYHYSEGEWVKWGTNSVTCGRTPLFDRISEMDTDADLVVIACGTNDFYYCWSDFGTMADGISNPDKTTFYGALHLVCRYLVDTYKGKDVVFINIIKRVQYSPWHCYAPLDKNYFGKTIEDYNKAIKEVCDYYSIPVVDLYSTSLLNPSFDTSMFVDQSTSSGLYFTHPNDAGHVRMAKLVKAFLMQYISQL